MIGQSRYSFWSIGRALITDKSLQVWAREEGSCTATLVGHQAAVSCLALGEDKIVSGSDDQTIKIWSFSG